MDELPRTDTSPEPAEDEAAAARARREERLGWYLLVGGFLAGLVLVFVAAGL